MGKQAFPVNEVRLLKPGVGSHFLFFCASPTSHHQSRAWPFACLAFCSTDHRKKTDCSQSNKLGEGGLYGSYSSLYLTTYSLKTIWMLVSNDSGITKSFPMLNIPNKISVILGYCKRLQRTWRTLALMITKPRSKKTYRLRHITVNYCSESGPQRYPVTLKINKFGSEKIPSDLKIRITKIQVWSERFKMDHRRPPTPQNQG